MKRSLARVLSALVALALTMSVALAAGMPGYGVENDPNEKTYTQKFSDVASNHWAFQYIAELVERGAINGYPDGKFYPDKIVTREEFAKIMVVAAGRTAASAQTSSYLDVPLTYWASPFIETAKPYMTAYQSSDGLRFRPTDGALREDIAVAVVKLKGYDARLADLSMIRTMFSDVDAISAAAQPYVALAVENGIISGYTDGTFRGQATITRSEAAAMLWRAFQYGSDAKVIAGETTAPPAATVAARPTPAPTAKPAAATEAAKPFATETLVRNVEITDTDMMMTMDDNSSLIFYDRKSDQILSLDLGTGATSVLLSVGDAVVETTAGAGEGVGPIAYEDLTVNQVFWDGAAGQLLVRGRFAAEKSDGGDNWSLPGKGTGLDAVFVLEDGVLRYLAPAPGYSSLNSTGEETQRTDCPIMCALSDGTFVVKLKQYHCIFDLAAGEQIARICYYDRHKTVFQDGSDIYAIRYQSLSKYNYGTGKLEETTGNISGDANRYANNRLYTWSSSVLKAVRPSDGAEQIKLDPVRDVDIQDLRPLPTTPDNLFVTADEQYLFYDKTSNAIRVIRQNTAA